VRKLTQQPVGEEIELEDDNPFVQQCDWHIYLLYHIYYLAYNDAYGGII
jgi:hypothetical protein